MDGNHHFRRQRTMGPAVIIGLGGAGTEAVCRAKRQLEADGCRWPAYLAIDGDAMSLERTSAEDTRLGCDETCDIAGIHLGAYLKNPNLLPGAHLREVIDGLDLGFAPAYGSGAVRRLGRFMLLSSAEAVEQKIRSAVERTCAAIRESGGAFDGSFAAVDVFILAGACGGTGSGALVDTARLAQEIIGGKIGMRLRLHGMIFMPDRNFDRLNIPFWQLMAPNAWAALKELECWMDSNHSRRFRQRYTREIAADTEQKPFDECFAVFGNADRGIYGDGVRAAADMIDAMVGTVKLYHGGMMSLRRTEYGLETGAFGGNDALAVYREAYGKAAAAGRYAGMRLWTDEELEAAVVRQPEPEPMPEPEPAAEPEPESAELGFFAKCLFYGLYRKIPPRICLLDGTPAGEEKVYLMKLQDYALAPAKEVCCAMYRKFRTLPAELKETMRRMADMREKAVNEEIMAGDITRYNRLVDNLRQTDAAVGSRMREIEADVAYDHPEVYEFYRALRGEFAQWLSEE